MNILWARAAERIVAIMAGALSIYLGYRLFIQVPSLAHESDGTLTLPGMEIVLTQVGPGVFFALFGAVVLWLSMRTQFTYEWGGAEAGAGDAAGLPQAPPGTRIPPGPGAIRYAAGVDALADKQSFGAARALLLRDVRALDRLSTSLHEGEGAAIAASQRADFAIALPRIKESLMLGVWGEDWGDIAEFKKWVDGGADDAAPENCEAAVRFFHGDGS